MTLTDLHGLIRRNAMQAPLAPAIKFMLFGIWHVPGNFRISPDGWQIDYERLGMEIEQYVHGLSHIDRDCLWKDFSQEELAESLHVRKEDIRKVFQLQFRKDFRVWKTEKRIALAMELLKRGAPLKAVASRSAYKDLPHFMRQFHSVVGCSPEKWRQRACPSDSEDS